MFYGRRKVIAVICGILALLLSLLLFFTWLMPSSILSQKKQNAGQSALYTTARFFSPYIDESLLQSAGVVGQLTTRDSAFAEPTTYLSATTQHLDVRDYTLGFIVDGGNCHASWEYNLPLANKTLLSNINLLRSKSGGDVIVSFGGSIGPDLAQTCPNAQALQAQYQSVVDLYQLKHLDFFISARLLADTQSYQILNQAVAGIQAAASKKHQTITVSYSMNVLPTGLGQAELNLLQNALSSGVSLDDVNLLAMNYGTAVQSTALVSGTEAAIQAAYHQLQTLQKKYPQQLSGSLWSHMGVTPMIGWNSSFGSDGKREIFTLDDAQQLLNYVTDPAHSLHSLSLWELTRDFAPLKPTNEVENKNVSISDTDSGVQEASYAFTKVFSQFALNASYIASEENVAPTPMSFTPTDVAQAIISNAVTSTKTAGATSTAIHPTPITVSKPTPTAAPTTPPPALTVTTTGDYNTSTNLTSVGQTDWRLWGDQSTSASGIYKASNGNDISGFTPLAAGAVSWSDYYPIDFSWSGGTPTSSGSGVTSGVYVPCSGNGFTFTVQSAGSGTLYVYAGVKYALGTLSAHWATKGGSTASSSFDMRNDATNSADNVRFAISFQPGFDNVTVTYACTPAASHTADAAIFLEAAALS